MIKTIIASSDWHIRPIKRHDEYKDQFRKLLIQVIRTKPDRIVIAGDLFHSKITVSNEMNQIIAKVLNTLAEHSKVIIIPGNHDAIINSSRMDTITPIVEMLNKDNIVYYKESGVHVDKWDNDVAWCVWSCLEHQKAPDIESFKRKNPGLCKSFIGLYHGVINGSTTDIGFTFTDEGVDPAEFFHTDIFIAGDIHKHQMYTYANYNGIGTGVMLGSLIQQDFGESVDKHGYVYMEHKDSGWYFEHNEIETDYGFHTIKITSADEIETL